MSRPWGTQHNGAATAMPANDFPSLGDTTQPSKRQRSTQKPSTGGSSFTDPTVGGASPWQSGPPQAAKDAGIRAAVVGATSSAKPLPAYNTPLSTPMKCSPYDAYIVLDFEATCEDNTKLDVQEIIEFPMVVVDPDSLTIVAEFQRYVKPVHNPKLTQFCTTLTGIQQSTVDAAAPFADVWPQALDWLRSGHLGQDATAGNRSVCFVTCGDWDLKTMLPQQIAFTSSKTNVASIPAIFKRWVNIKTAFGAAFSAGRATGMDGMLKFLRKPLVGHHHSGIDDCRNIATILIEVLKQNPALLPTSAEAGYAPPHRLVPSWPCTSLPQTNASPNAAPNVAPNSTTNVSTGVAKLLATPPPATPVSDRDKNSFSRKLTMILRHRAADFKLTMNKAGLVRLDDLMRLDTFRYLDLYTLGTIVRDCPKQRTQVILNETDGNLYIGATQGHSIETVEIADGMTALTAATDVQVAVHGTYLDAWPKILASGGLSPMGRQHVHFAIGLPGQNGVISGMRSNAEVLVYLDVAKALAEGLPLFRSANGVILTPGMGTPPLVPTKFFKSVVSVKTGKPLQ